MNDFLREYLPQILTLGAGAGAWGYERNKRNQEIKKAETSNHKDIMELYQEALNDLKSRYDANLRELEAKYDLKFKEMEARYNRLKKAFEDYKKKHQ